MSKKKVKKSKRTATMPPQSAGLLRFFEEETDGIKVKPELTVIFAAVLIVACILAQIFF